MATMSIEERARIERRALTITAAIEAREGKYFADIAPGCEPQWHLLEVAQNQEFKALKFLSDRRIGVFVPRFAPDASYRFEGVELCGGRRLIFPGRVFVFVWNILEHWRRIAACPGVMRVMCDRWEHPVVIPDRFIDEIQALQYTLTPAKKRKRYRRRRLGAADDDGRLVISTVSALHGSDGLSVGERLDLLDYALGVDRRSESASLSVPPEARSLRSSLERV